MTIPPNGTTAVERFVEDAIDGGWEGLEFNDSIRIDDFAPVSIHSRVWGESKLGEGHLTTVAQILLDPAAWQAVGKVRLWCEGAPCMPNGECSDCSFHHEYGGYIRMWHEFIDLLAQGKDIEAAMGEIEV